MSTSERRASVLQPWVETCSWKEQTVLLCSLRGPDISGNQDIKEWVRFIRRNTLMNADPKTSFMVPSDPPSIFSIGEKYPRVFDSLPLHFITHFLHGLQILACRHPDNGIGVTARQAYSEMCDYMHVNPEWCSEMTERLKDEV